jgi:ATP-dependent helicase/nuclease subunit A
MTARGITIIGASAGSGKTYRLTQEVTDAIDPRAEHRIDLEGLVAVTYTRRAHAELATRIRTKLVQDDAFEESVRLPLAYLGTVHSACLRLLQEFALDAGLSPNVDVVAGDQAKLLRESLEQSIGGAACSALDRLAASFELLWQPKVERYDWLRPVTDIMELARSNRIAPGALAAMAERSAAGLLRLLPPAAPDGALLDEALERELRLASTALGSGADTTKTTLRARELIDACRSRMRDGELRWSHWEKLARIETAKASSSAVAELQASAMAYSCHPRLHEEIGTITRAIFDAARVGFSGYEAWKKERRVVDYVDMVSGALDIAHHPRVSSELAARLRFIVVDEFQDTSPIQLALFLRLHMLAGRSAWVGDRKQCIFEYAGADPALMDAVASWVGANGGARDQLADNHRSRPDLVTACSELFAGALAHHGFSRGEVVVAPVRPRASGAEALPPLGLFCLETENKSENAEAIADGVRQLLTDRAATPIPDRATKMPRDVRPGDVAVLVATNVEARQLAEALHARGIRVALARAGLLSTPEGTLADAALRVLVDANDSLSSATIDALTGFGGRSPESWLQATIEAKDRGDGPVVATSGWRATLERVRQMLGVLSPAEALDEALTALDAVHLCARWPNSEQRIANLDALRVLAAGYEQRCGQEREAGTVAGLLRHFDDLRTERLRRDEMLASDDQHVSSDDDAVTVCTYHKAKGLEWPVVVMASLDRTEKRHAFEVRPESDRDEGAFDPSTPLEGRWIRYWPWPLGGLDVAPLAEAAEAAPEGRRVADREAKERVRLLYVGFTRARDHLVLAVRVAKGKAKTQWLDELANGVGQPLLELPIGARDGAADIARIRCEGGPPLDVPTRVWRLGPDRPSRVDEPSTAPRWFARAALPDELPSYWIAPSRAEEEWPELPRARIGAVETLASAVLIAGKGIGHDVLGTAVHAFLAADVEGLSRVERAVRAEQLLAAAELSAVVRSDALLAASDALRTWVERRWPGAVWRREVTIEALIESRFGERRVSGVIDLLLETREGRVLIDHKTFPGTTEPAWRARVKGFLPQMAAYAAAVERVGDRPVVGNWVHLPMGGGMVEILRA